MKIDKPDALRGILKAASALLLDFDGPICSIFSSFPSIMVADILRSIARDRGYTDLPISIQMTKDPFTIFRHSAILDEELARALEEAMTECELRAVETADETAGSRELIYEWNKSKRPIFVVSNNSVKSISKYLDIHELTTFITGISARTSHNPSTLKPNPHLVRAALQHLQISPSEAIFVGDSDTDSTAGIEAGVRNIGYANKPHKKAMFELVKVDAIVNDMTLLAAAAR